MFYDDEKDIIGDLDNSSDIQISEDGVVSWPDSLEDDSDAVLGINKKSSVNADASSGLDDELQIADSNDEPDEEELRRILSEGDSTDLNTDSTGAGDISEDLNSEDGEFNFDENLLESNPNTTEDLPEEEITPRNAPSKSNQNSSLAILIALLVAIVAVGGGFWIYTFLQQNNASSGDLQVNNQIKDITSEDLENRASAQEDIPVVNDDTKDVIKADPTLQAQALQAENKQTVDIKTGGRSNPFLPVSKYLSVNVPDSYINFENPSIPQPPEEYAPENKQALDMVTISVSGIMYDDIKPSAIITYEGEDYFVQRGDKLNEYRVIDINKNYVLIALGRNTYKANVGEEFKITDNFYGNAKYLPTGRQYHAVSKKDGMSDSTSAKGKKSSDSVEMNID